MKVFKRFFYGFAIIGLVCLNIQCKSEKKKGEAVIIPEEKATVTISNKAFGTTPEGENVDLYTLKNQKGIEIKIMTYGGIITSLKVPNKNNISEDVVLGFDSLAQYTKNNPYFGALIGRYGNRIAKGKFTLDGVEYKLATNDGPNHLHGGVKGFDKVVWNATEVLGDSIASLKLSYMSKDMEEGYPGNLNVDVTYTLTNDNILDVAYEATTDKKTIINLTQHSYFNLSGDFTKTILDNEITINADKFIPVDKTLIPTGELKDVTNTPFDFREGKVIGKDIELEDIQLKRGGGYDHCWVLNNPNKGVRLAATVYHQESGRLLEIFSDEPGIQFYSGNFLNSTFPRKGGGVTVYRSSLCLETQHYPDSPNQKDFPSVILKPGEKYSSKTSFKFSVK